MVDSTRGKSVIDPVDYKGDALVQVWIDSRVLATLSIWLDGEGDPTRFLSEVVKVPLSALVELLVGQGDVELVDDTAEARAMLRRKYRVNLNPQGRGGKNVLHNVVLSDRRRKLGGVVRGILDGAEAGDVSVPMGRAGRASAKELAEEALEIYQGLEEEDLGKAKQETDGSIPELGFVKDEEVDDSKIERSDEETESK